MATVDFAAMADPKHQDKDRLILYFRHNAVIADAVFSQAGQIAAQGLAEVAGIVA